MDYYDALARVARAYRGDPIDWRSEYLDLHDEYALNQDLLAEAGDYTAPLREAAERLAAAIERPVSVRLEVYAGHAPDRRDSYAATVGFAMAWVGTFDSLEHVEAAVLAKHSPIRELHVPLVAEACGVIDEETA